MKTLSPTANKEPERRLSHETDASRASRFSGNHRGSISQRKFRMMMDKSPQVQRLEQLQARIDHSPQQIAQRKRLEGIFRPIVQRKYHYSKNWASCNDVGENEWPEVSVEDVVKLISNAEVVKYRDASDGGDMYIKTNWHVSDSDPEVHFTAELGLDKYPWKSETYPVRVVHVYPNGSVRVFENELKKNRGKF